MNNIFKITAMLMLFLASCTNNAVNKKEDSVSQKPSVVAVSTVMTAEQQAALTPDDVIRNLQEGNNRFVRDSLTPRNYIEQVKKSAKGQYPEAVILSCIDSRVPVEYVFDKGIGDLFVIRVAGNLVNEDIKASMEYGCKVSGSKLILILGHSSCGAIKSAIDEVKLGNITQLLEKIKPAIEKSAGFNGEKSSKNDEYVEMVALNNVLCAIDYIKARSPILKEMSDKGQIKIVGGIYDLKTGIVKFLD
jgi:carbonic anhydrase